MYEITHDRESATLRLRLTGFWTNAVMNRFAADLRAAMAQAEGDGPFVIFSDCRAYPVQSAEVSDGWVALLGPDTRITQPYAVLVGSTLGKLQAERALAAPNLRIFLLEGEAIAWLDERRRALG